MVYPQGESNDPFDATKGFPPNPDPGHQGQENYPPFQNPQYPDPQYPDPQYSSTQYSSTQYPGPQYPNTQYGGTPYAGYGYQTPPRTNTLAIVSLVMAVLGFTFLPLISSICAVVFGHIARGQIRRTGEGGSGFATAGLIIGYVSIVLFVIAVGALILFAIAASSSSSY